MKCLKIEDNKGWFSFDGENWSLLDTINKNDILRLFEIAVRSDFEMEDYDKDIMGNQAHQVIYSNIYEKFKEIVENKSRFKDESEIMYKSAIEKYSK